MNPFTRSIQLLLLAALAAGGQAGLLPAVDWQSRVDPEVLEAIQQGESEFLVYLAEQADLSPAANLESKSEKGAFVYQRLTEVARRSQASILAELEKSGAAYRAYWIANLVWVRGDQRLLEKLASRPDVAHIYANPRVRMELPPAEGSDAASLAPIEAQGVEWNIQLVGAPQVWAKGVTGEGAVIGGQDTGYQWQHPALQNAYRGWDGSSVDHNYQWHDAIHADVNGDGVNLCGFNLDQPCDDYGHGTATMGVMVGDDGLGNQVGMAPGGRWIGCRNMESGVGTPLSYIECYQWFVAPTDLNNANPRPDLAPDVINNSWGCPASEGCTDPAVLLEAVQAVRAAGILTVHSAGNSGYKGCSSVETPANIYAESFTIGATDNIDLIAGFSSRGPVTIDGSNRLKPDLSAPGVGIRSSALITSDTSPGYGNSSGTSLAAPHVAGAAALLISAVPGLRGQPELIEQALQENALPRYTSEGCGGDSTSSLPNHTYGWGRLDAWKAFINASHPIHVYLPVMFVPN
jgi:subtilisin family serine protease